MPQVALELGMGRGRVALHLFLAGATVLGGGAKCWATPSSLRLRLPT